MIMTLKRKIPWTGVAIAIDWQWLLMIQHYEAL
jgi:hypothetical protein